MGNLTSGDITEIRLYYSNHPKESYEDIARHFNLSKGTIWRIINKGDPISPDAPFKRVREETILNDSVAVREQPRTEALIAGARNEGKEIMKKLDSLLQGQDARLSKVLEAEAEFRQALKGKGMDSEERYHLEKEMNKDYNIAILGLKSTLHQMAELSRSINIFVDNRKILNVTYEQLPPMARQRMDEAVTERLIGDMWPLMCPECKARFIELTKVQPMEPEDQRS
jgi:hypothetical protein